MNNLTLCVLFQRYLQEISTDRKWAYEPSVVTDEKPENLILGHVRATLLDFLPHEIPYKLRQEIEYFEMKKGAQLFHFCFKLALSFFLLILFILDEIVAHVNIICHTERLVRLVRGSNNDRVKLMCEIVTSDLVRMYKLTVSLSINVIAEQQIK